MRKTLSQKNKANKFDVNFSNKINEGTNVSFEIDDSSISFKPHQSNSNNEKNNGKTAPAVLANVAASVEAQKVSYKDAFPNTEINYTVGANKLKEDIVLSSVDAPTSYSFLLDLTNLKYEAQKDGSIKFTHADSGEFAFIFSKPYMFEDGEQPDISEAVTQTIRQEGDQLILDIVADAEWIQDPERKFPITIDPTIETDLHFFKDTYVSSSNPTTKTYYLDTHVYAGTNTTHGQMEGYVVFPLPALPEGARIVTDVPANPSTIELYNFKGTSNTTVDVYPITSWWAENNVTWNTKPQKGTKTTSALVAGSGWKTFDITPLIADWYSGKTPNNGVAFAANPTSAPEVGFTSSNHTVKEYHPKLNIYYTVDPDGTSDFWTYTDDEVMPFKGNLNFTTVDVETDGRGYGAAVSRTYNSRQWTANGVFGSGRLSNLDMRLWDLSGSVVFLDESGNRYHFMHNNNDTYTPVAGVYLSLNRASPGRIR
ncbi:DNRLRE domain-containing protein [Paenibacillus sp. strain BS8-2]